MGKSLTVVAVAGLAVLLILPAVLALEPANPGQPQNPTTGDKVIVVQPGGSTGASWVGREKGQYGAYVPPVPVPPGVLGAYSQLPCAVPSAARTGFGTEYLVRELGERK